MIDLHTHTTYSDGTWSVDELLTEAQAKNIQILSITDHNTIAAHLELEKKENILFKGKIIPGCECDGLFQGAKIELLGYNFDIKKIKEWMDKIYHEDHYKPDLDKEFKLLIEGCKRNNIKIDHIDYHPSLGWPIDTIYPEIKRHPENRQYFTEEQWNDAHHFFRCCSCDPNFLLYLDFSDLIPPANVVSNAIREANGKVFLAHLFTYPMDDYEKFLDKLREEKLIDGIEVYYPTFTADQTTFLEEYCDRYQLLKSVGSDSHGEKPPIRVPGEISIDFKEINWL